MKKKQDKTKFIIGNLKKDLELDIRAFLKKYGKPLKGPGKVAILVFFMTKALNKSVSSTKIKNQWNKVKNLLKKYNPVYIIRAREYEFIKKEEGKKGHYKLTNFWCEKLLRKERLKLQQIISGMKQKKTSKHQEDYILPASLLNKIKKQDKKIPVLGFEANLNWQSSCWNSCGILMRIVLERALDKKNNKIKQIKGLEPKINYCLSNKIFSKTLSDALKKLQHSTKITGDIVAHDSNLLLNKNDIELAIVSLNMLIKDVFKL